MRCPCGCGRLVKPGKRYGARGCSLRVIPREVRAARARSWALAHLDECRASGSKGGWRTRKRRWDDLIDQWLDDDVRPADALATCYKRGYSSGYLAGLRQIRKQKATAA